MKKENLFKKISAIMLICIVSFLIVACGKEERDVNDLVYTGEILSCLDEIKGDYASYTIMEDAIYLYTTQWVESEVETVPGIESAIGSEMNEYLYRYSADGSGLEEIPLNFSTQSGESLSYFRISSRDEIFFLYNFYNPETGELGYILRIATKEGVIRKETDITDLLGEEEVICLGMELDEEGNLYLLTEKTLFVLDEDGNLLAELEEENTFTGIAVNREGRVIVSLSGEDFSYVRRVEGQPWKLKEKVELPLDSRNHISLISGGEYDFYYTEGLSIFGFDEKKGESKELLNWASSNVNSNYIGEARALLGGRFVASYYDSSRNDLYLFTKVDPKELEGITEITYAAPYVDDGIRAKAMDYNNSQDKYRVVVKDYSSSEDPVKAMEEDIKAGNVPDIMEMSGLSPDSLMAGGVLTDLYELMEKDSEIEREDFIENILAIMETEGKLYRITPSFGINMMVGKSSNVEKQDIFTLEDLKELEKKKGPLAKAFYRTSNMDVLTQIFGAEYYYFVNWQKGECYFDSPEFVDLLEYAGTYPSGEELDLSGESDTLSAMLESEEILFATTFSMSVEEIQLYKALFQSDIAFVGYPSQGKNGGAISMNMQLGIPARSQNKEGAWNFLKTFLTRESMSGNSELTSFEFPIRKDSLEDLIKRYTTKEKYVDDFGNEILPYQSKWGYDDKEITITSLSEEESEMLRDVVTGANHMYVYDEKIYSIVMEEAEVFFNEQASGDAVAERIQEKVLEYMQEATKEDIK